MGYNRAVKTEAGIELLSRVTAGETTITFTKIATSENTIDNFEIKQQVNPSASKFTRDNKVGVILDAIFSNTDVTVGYDINVIGIYAKDSNNVEIMFSYLTADSNPAHINPYNGETPENVNIQVEAGIWLDDGTMISIDPSGVATIQFVKNLLESYTDVLVPTTGWTETTDASSNIYYYIDITVVGMTDQYQGTNCADFVTTSPLNIDTYNNNLADFSKMIDDWESHNGYARLKASEPPTNPLTIRFYGI